MKGRVWKLFAAGFLTLCVLAGPNVFWLARSTVRIENRSPEPIPAVVITACSTEIPLGVLPPGASRFRVLPQCGDASMTVASASGEACRIYVEGALYHIRVWFSAPGAGDCVYTSPPFSPLLVAELI